MLTTVVILAVGIFSLPSLVSAVAVSSTDRYAWGENIGWLDFGSTEGAVDVPLKTGDLTGYVWVRTSAGYR